MLRHVPTSNGWRPISNLGSIFLTIVLCLSPISASNAATATAGSGAKAVRNASDAGSATWRFFNPSPLDTITWTSGANQTDGTNHPQTREGTEFKFQFPPNPGDDFTGRLFNGFNDVDGGPAPARSEAITSGRGLSQGIPVLFGTNAIARWTVTATGKLGGATGASWSSTASGNDPMVLTEAAFSDVSESFYDLFFEVGLTEGIISPRGSIGMSVRYETSLGIQELIRISLAPTAVSVTGGDPTALALYLLSDFSEGPTEVAANLVDAVALEALLEDDFLSNLQLDVPLHLGVVLEDLARPTTPRADGALARIHVDLTVADAAVREVNAPATLHLLPAALAFLMGLRGYRRRSNLIRTPPAAP